MNNDSFVTIERTLKLHIFIQAKNVSFKCFLIIHNMLFLNLLFIIDKMGCF